jgi:hypothetical protein
VIVFPDTQYEYFDPLKPPDALITLPAVVYEPLVGAPADTSPIPPVCWMVPEQLHPPPAELVHVTVEKPACSGPVIPSHVVVVPDI